MNIRFNIFLIILFSAVIPNCKNGGNIPVENEDQKPEGSFTYIDISEAANVGFVEEEITDLNGNKRIIPALSMYNSIPPGIHVFDNDLISFKIVDPVVNNKIAILLQKSSDPEKDLHISKNIPVDGIFSELYLLHTVMGVEESEEPESLVNYRISYDDGTELIFECQQGNQVDDCWETSRRLESGIRNFHDGHFWLINTSWKNPYPEKKINWVRIESTGNATALLFAITGANDHDAYAAIMNKIQNRIQKHQLSNLRIALIQLSAKPNVELNLQRGEQFCRQAKSMGADIAVFPEMYSVGYASIDFDQPNALDECEKVAQESSGPFVRHFMNLARELDMAILITYLEKDQDKFRNSATLIDRHGQSLMTYSKVHTLDFFKMEASFEPGKGFEVVDLDTRFGPVKTGIMICYDREFPESARVLMLKGAELILTPNACGLDPLRINQFQTRAWENAVVCAMSNYAEGQWYNGHSCAYNANGDQILMAGEAEGVFLAEVNMVEVKEIREDTYWGNAFRRPHKYENLISTEVEEPFTRENVFGEPFRREKR